MSNSFMVGDRVLLSDKIGFQPTPHWPVMGSFYHCEGLVTTIREDMVRVRWDNGNVNVHLQTSLIHLNTVEEIPV